LSLIPFLYHAATYIYPPLTIQIINRTLNGLLSLQYFGWFAIGALLYKTYTENDNKYLLLSLVLLPPIIVETGGRDFGVGVSCLVVYLVFVLVLLNQNISKIFASKILVFIGFISYPLYLIHENAMVAFTIKTHVNFPSIPDMLTPLPGISLLLVSAFVIANYLEPFVKKHIKSSLLKIKPTPLSL
jgi:peptidoglycan/LPS O-acetylase OafA/YrhL